MSLPPDSVTILITSANEPATIGPALEALLSAPPPSLVETLVVCPDEATAQAAGHYSAQGVRVVRDPGLGKPAALNLGLSQARGEIVVLSDGDVRVDPRGWPRLLAPFSDPSVGAVTGRPVSVSPRGTPLGYWSHLLTEAGAHAIRLERDQTGGFFLCSGYLYAFRKALAPRLPEDALAEDAVISHHIWSQGSRIRYVLEARVYVRYPESYSDWVKQKQRSLAGYQQEYVRKYRVASRPHGGLRSFRSEFAFGALRSFQYARNAREVIWTALLFLARAHVWLSAFVLTRLTRRTHSQIWARVDSTK